ncbi:MAG: UbiD family decarboxylase [Pseudomonadota bacterium]|nr:UbiD family decarboxylase [Pseudomonadota bacterium]
MTTSFRDIVENLRRDGHVEDITKPVDIRHIATLVDKSEKALVFHNVNDYAMPVISGVANSRERIGAAFDCLYEDVYRRLDEGLSSPIEPELINGGPVRQILMVDDDVDLFELPVPLFSIHDGGPMITAGVTIAKSSSGSLNAGIYRFLLREKNLTGIDIVTPNDLQLLALEAFRRNESLPISINIGTHLAINVGATYRAPMGQSELAIAGGMLGGPIQLTPGETVDVPCIADAEIVLEAEILPTGWTKPEGRFGEFTRLMGGLHWNPQVKIKAISMRKDAMYYALHMPWEVILPGAPNREAAVRRAFKTANLDLVNVNITPGGSCYFHAIVSIRKRPGDAKHAIMAALVASDIKHVVVVDEDIDVFNGTDVEWAIATRVQADRDIVIIPDLRAKPLDPSLKATPGRTPITTKCGIDATIPDDLPRERFERIEYAYANQVDLKDYLGAGEETAKQSVDVDITELAVRIEFLIEKKPLYFEELAKTFEGEGFKAVTRAIGELHAANKLWQDPEGRLCLSGTEFAAEPPPTI